MRVFKTLCQGSFHRAIYFSSLPSKCMFSCDIVRFQFCTERIQTLRDHPDIGRVVAESADPKLRELIHPPFRVVYLRENTAIHVIRVWRSERLLVLPEEGA